MINVKRMKDVDSTNLEIGTVAYSQEDQNFFMYNGTDWDPVEINFGNEEEEINTGLTLYDLNKSIVSQLKPMTIEEIQAKEDVFKSYKEKSGNDYHMLLCKDYSYYTIFKFNMASEFKSFGEAVITIITELGDVYGIEEQNDGAIEIWIKPNYDEDVETPYAFYLFPYDAGVVYYG